MHIVTTRQEFRDALDSERRAGRTVGLVPTMGALHEGHLSLIAAARAECDVAALTIFVNPLQFAPTEDLAAYPRPIERDLELADAAGTTIVFTPSTEEMYPEPIVTSVHVEGLTSLLEGASRPTHFDGVTTVVSKLFNLAGPCRAYFGEKDFQQLAVVTRMARDLDQPVTVVPCPIVREPDGLAMSSRNVYLDPEQRAAALVLDRALRHGADLVAAGEHDPFVDVGGGEAEYHAEPLAVAEYLTVVDPETLVTPTSLVAGTEVRLLGVVRFGTTRLLDNRGVGVG